MNSDSNSYGSTSSSGSQNELDQELVKIANDFYQNIFRKAIVEQMGKKHVSEMVNQFQEDNATLDLDSSKQQIMRIKKGYKESMAKCTIFDICHLIWFSPDFDHFYFIEEKSTTKYSQGVSRQKISFGEFAKNKNNFQFI